MDAELRRKREEVLQRHMDGESDKDVDAVLATMPDPTYNLATIDRVLRGRDEVGPFLQKMFDLLPEYRHRAAAFHHAEDSVVVEVDTLFPKGSMGNGSEEHVKTVGIFAFDGEKLLAETAYVEPDRLLPLLPD